MITRFFCALLLTGAAWSQAPYNNPIIGNPDRVDHEVADPFVLKFNGEYYLYTSGDPITAFHSTDLVHWDPIGPVLSSSQAPGAWNQADVWAPEVVYRNGKFYMYYTASLKSDDWRVGEMARRIGVAVSDSPRGPFVDSGKPVTPGWGIDGDVFRDPDTGDEYLFYSYLYEPRLPGAGIVADKMTAPDAVAGKPSHITRGSEAWEDKDGDPNNGSLRYTNEGPTVLKHHGRYYMLYSGGSWDLPTYNLAYAWSDTVLPEGGLSGNGWNKVVPPILRSTPLVDAPGHNTVVKAPNNVDDINIYHARKIPFLEPWNRLPFADRLYWNHDTPFSMQPSLGDMPAPDQPIYAITSDTRSVLVTTHGEPESFTYYVYEANLAPGQTLKRRRAVGDPPVGAGVMMFRHGGDILSATFSADAVVLHGTLGGKETAAKSVPLPKDFSPNVLHQVLVTRNAGHFELTLDGGHLISADYPVDAVLGAVGNFAEGVSAILGYTALTPFFDDTFESPASGNSWKQQSGSWLVEEGALHQVKGGPELAVALKGDATANYEFSASMRLRDADSTAAKIGIVAAASGSPTQSNDLVLASFDKNIWPFARFWVQHVVGGKVAEEYPAPLPRGFQYDEYHTIRVMKQGSAFTFFLDGAEISAVRVTQTGPTRPGLFTEGARAAFDNVSMKWTIVPQNLILNGSFETEQWDASHATKDNPWQLAGTAREHYCCAHSGLRRLLFRDGDGEAKQTVPNLAPGKYRLDAFAQTTGKAQLNIGANGKSTEVPSASAAWTKVSLDFEVPAGSTFAEIILRGSTAKNTSDFAVLDDVYLYRLP